MRISDWSSDVCSSDLQELNGLTRTHMKRKLLDQLAATHDFDVPPSMVEAEFSQIWQQLLHEASHEADVEAAKAEMEAEREDRKSVVSGRGVSVRVDLGGRRSLQKELQGNQNERHDIEKRKRQ